MGLRDWFLRLFHRKPKTPNAREEYQRAKENLIASGTKLMSKAVDEAFKPYEPLPQRPRTLGDIRAVRKMRHGHQAPWYRKSVKANVKPEEDN